MANTTESIIDRIRYERVYEVFFGKNRGCRTVTSLAGAKRVLRREFGTRVFLSNLYDTDMGEGWIAFPSLIARAEHLIHGPAERPDICDEGPALPRIERWQREVR